VKATKISDEQVRNIRARVAEGASRKELAVYYGVTYETISRIVRGESRVSPAEVTVKPFQREVSDEEIAAGARRMFQLQQELTKSQGTEDLAEFRPAQEEDRPPAVPALVVPEGTALSPERVRWLLGGE